VKLAAGILWVAVIIMSAFISAFVLHLPTVLLFLWGMMTAAVATFIVRSVDYSQFYGVGILSRLERFRLPVLLVSFPMSLICLALANSVASAWTVGITTTFLTLVIMISYTVHLKQ
jgi:hypothetical protein